MKLRILFVVFSLAAAAAATTGWLKFKRMFYLNGKVCEDTDVVFSKENVKYQVLCLHECTKYVNCKSVFYVQNTGSCVGCIAIYGNPRLPTGETVGSIHFWKVKCPEGWFHIGDSCYYITDVMSFEEGVIECQSMRAQPVSIETTDESTSLKSKLRHIASDESVVAYFTAYTYDAGIWKAVGTANPLTVDDWGEGEPNPGPGENCLAFYEPNDFQWAVISCQMSYKTICETNTLY